MERERERGCQSGECEGVIVGREREGISVGRERVRTEREVA